jgi:hypothetical protein
MSIKEKGIHNFFDYYNYKRVDSLTLDSSLEDFLLEAGAESKELKNKGEYHVITAGLDGPGSVSYGLCNYYFRENS